MRIPNTTPTWLKGYGWLALVLVLWQGGCKSKGTAPAPGPPPTPEPALSTTVRIARSQPQQTIDGFGFFGAQGVWWEGNAANLYSEAWATQVIEDLGISIWRNEYYPPATATQNQDADWAKQRPVVEGLAKVAKAKRVPLKFLFTVWSPPADLKCNVAKSGNEDVRQPGVPHPGGAKQGGALDPGKYTEFANWLADGIQLYKDAGADIYAISPQNEPLFAQSFNSCFYKPEWYAEMVKDVIPKVKARFPNVKIYGSENMLEMEAGNDRQWFYHRKLQDDAAAGQQLDIWATHGYVEGVTPTSTSRMAQLWQTARTEKAASNKPQWMTETSGYTDAWPGTATKAGALDLGLAIHAALYHGNAAAWVWWQGSTASNAPSEYELMQGTTKKSKRYYVSKHFYRFIRPGARMVKLDYTEADGVFASAYEHAGMGSFTVVLINTKAEPVKVNLDGANLPDTFEFYQTTASDDCLKKTAVGKGNVVLPAQSIVTLVNGTFME